MSELEIEQLVMECSKKESGFEILKAEPGIMVVRYPETQFGNIVAKLWDRSSWKSKIRKRAGWPKALQEWQMLQKFQSYAIPSPKPIGWCYLSKNKTGFTEAVVMEDLGRGTDGLVYLKRLIQDKDEVQIQAFEDRLIAVTKEMLESKILCEDHSLFNFYVTDEGNIYRLDLELAQHVINPLFHPKQYLHMLGRLLVSYTYAVQPDVERTTAFAKKMVHELRPPFYVLWGVKRYLKKKLKFQKEKYGIDTTVILPF